MSKIMSSAVALAFFAVSAPAMAAEGNAVDGFGAFSVGYNVLNPGSATDGLCDTSLGCETQSTADPAILRTTKGLDLNGRVSVAVPLGAFGAQIDGEYSRTVYRASRQSSEEVLRSVKLNDSTFAGHVFLRDPGFGLAGLVVQRTSTNGNFGTGYATYYIGGEGQYFLGKATVYGQVVYGSDDASETDSNGVNAQLQLRYFPQDNLKLALRGGFESFKVRADARFDPQSTWSSKAQSLAIGANAEYRLANSRVSLLGDVDYRAIKLKQQSGGEGVYSFERMTAGDLRFMVGVKLNFGSGALFERDRSGASLDPVRALGQHAAHIENGSRVR